MPHAFNKKGGEGFLIKYQKFFSQNTPACHAFAVAPAIPKASGDGAPRGQLKQLHSGVQARFTNSEPRRGGAELNQSNLPTPKLYIKEGQG